VWFAWLALCLLPPSWGADLATRSGQVIIRSRSDQFVVHSLQSTAPTLGQVGTSTATNSVVIEPETLAVTCERMKAALLRQLDLRDQWRDKIHFWVRVTFPSPADPQLAIAQYADGWRYNVTLPDEMPGDRLARVLLQLLLLEMANRQPGSCYPELPAWLIDGLAAELMSGVGPDLLVQSTPLVAKSGDALGELQNITRTIRVADTNRQLRADLTRLGPLSFNQLSLPAAPQSGAVSPEAFRVSAQVFVRELLALPRGRPALAAMLGNLTQTLNWQTAFLAAYRHQFERLVDVEKWWTMTALHYTAAADSLPWRPEVAFGFLEQVLQVTVQTQASRKEAPVRIRASLSRILRDWDFKRQGPILQDKVRQLQVLRNHTGGPLQALINDYLHTLQRYLEERPLVEHQGRLKNQTGAGVGLMVARTARTLEQLDDRRVQLSGPPSRPAVGTEAPVP
jgi:hypothetical protein